MGDKMSDEMTERPPCFGCESPAYLIIGRRAYCGECALKIDEAEKTSKEKDIKELLTDAA